MNGRLSSTEAIAGQTMQGYPDFGHNMLKYWKFDSKCSSAHVPPG